MIYILFLTSTLNILSIIGAYSTYERAKAEWSQFNFDGTAKGMIVSLELDDKASLFTVQGQELLTH